MLQKLGRITQINQRREGPHAPPGQFVTEKFPVLTFGPTPRIDLATWQFRIFGLVEEEITLDWQEFNALTQTKLDAEFHCVTQWSKLQNVWEGILFTDLIKLVTPKPEAKYVMAHCYGGYTTNVALDVLNDDDVLFAHSHDGAPLDAEHGGPHATRRSEALWLEERQVGQRNRVHGRGRARLLGDARLPHGGRPLEGRTLLEYPHLLESG